MVAIEQRVGDHDAAVHVAQRVAVGRALGDDLEADAAVGAAAIVDHQRLAERRLRARRERPRHQIGAAARREADDQPHRPRRIILAARGHPGRDGEGRRAQRGGEQAAAMHDQASTCSTVGASPASVVRRMSRTSVRSKRRARCMVERLSHITRSCCLHECE